MRSFLQYLIENSPSDSRPNENDKRPDGTVKGPGWRGSFKNKHRQDVSEYSISVPTSEIEEWGRLPNGAILHRPETLIPLLVSDSTDEEVAEIIGYTETNGRPSNKIVEKAFRHAQNLIKQGKSPFAPAIIKSNPPQDGDPDFIGPPSSLKLSE